jgi:DNA invertase Pin-like site-specific DNA recombinase
LDQEFNSLDAQYDAASAYIKSQAHAGWTLIRSRYDDGGYSGGSTDRPDLQRLLDDIRGRKLDIIVVYKVDRLTRSLGRTELTPGTVLVREWDRRSQRVMVMADGFAGMAKPMTASPRSPLRLPVRSGTVLASSA